MTANSYPGNSSLAPEVKERVISTFLQTLSLFDEGQLDEVIAGCDLILEMDDRFAPARKLRQKAKDPAAPVDLTELYALRDSQASGEAPSTSDPDALLVHAVEALNAGDYEEAINVCNSILSVDPGHEEAQRVGQQANDRLEAAPFITQFIQEADTAIENGDLAAARTHVEKARSLDPTHPKIASTVSKIDAAEEAATSQPATGGFDFGGDSSPFASAFGAGEEAGESSDAFAADIGTSEVEAPVEPESTAEPSSSFDFGAADEEPPAAGFVSETEDAPEPPSPPGEASSFGFTLEEEPEHGIADEPVPAAAPEAPAGEAQTFDFSTGDAEVSEGDQNKIESYLKEGDALFEAGEYQDAIDSWSKIFLIDVTNEQASERIERAKDKKREADQKLDDLVTTGIAAYDRGDYTTARDTFEEVLAQDPDNFRAGEYLEKLDDHSAATGGEAGDFAVPPPTPPPTDLDSDDSLYEGDMYEGEDELASPPPSRSAAAPAKGAAAAPKRAAKKSSKGMLIAVIAVIALAVGGWLGWSMLGGGGEPDRAAAGVTQGKITRANVLAEQGDFAQAISLLSSVEPGDPMREQALQLIAQYRQRQAETGGTIGGRPMNQVRDELLSRARESFAGEDYVAAKSAFEEAAKLKALEGADREMYDAASRQVSKLDAATALFAQGSYEDAIQELSAILAQEPDNLNAREMLGNAHFNLGVNALKSRNTERAIEEFNSVLEQNPDDTMARRSLEIARQYEGKQKDLMYEIFVKYLPLR